MRLEGQKSKRVAALLFVGCMFVGAEASAGQSTEQSNEQTRVGDSSTSDNDVRQQSTSHKPDKADSLIAQGKKKKKKGKKAKAEKKAKEDSEEEKTEETTETTTTTAGGGLQRGRRMEFDARLIRGERAAGAVYLFQRVPRPLPSMVKKRSSYLEDTVSSVLGNRWAANFTKRAEKQKAKKDSKGTSTPKKTSVNKEATKKTNQPRKK